MVVAVKMTGGVLAWRPSHRALSEGCLDHPPQRRGGVKPGETYVKAVNVGSWGPSRKAAVREVVARAMAAKRRIRRRGAISPARGRPAKKPVAQHSLLADGGHLARC